MLSQFLQSMLQPMMARVQIPTLPDSPVLLPLGISRFVPQSPSVYLHSKVLPFTVFILPLFDFPKSTTSHLSGLNSICYYLTLADPKAAVFQKTFPAIYDITYIGIIPSIFTSKFLMHMTNINGRSTDLCDAILLAHTRPIIIAPHYHLLPPTSNQPGCKFATLP